MKRELGNVVHVTRGYGKNHNYPPHKNIRYDGENYKVEIRKFDRNFDKLYKTGDLSSKNMNTKMWRNLKILYCADKSKKTSITFDYKCTETGTYMVDLLYYDYNYDNTKCKGSIFMKIDNGAYKKQKSHTLWAGDDNNMNRHSQRYTFIKGKKYGFKYEFNKNTAVVAVIIKKYDTYTGTRYNDGDLTIEDIDVKINEDVAPNEATVTIWYNHELDDPSNVSGYLFDFRDEINIYKKDVDDLDFVQIFGGYISVPTVDDNDMTMKLSCADRLIDGDNRYCLQEMVMLGGETDESSSGYEYSDDSYESYDNRAEMLNYLTNIYELPLDNSDILEDVYFKKQFPKGYQWFYEKSLSPKTSFKNMKGTYKDDYLILRNGKNRDDGYNSYDDTGNRPQTGVILDVKTLKDPEILINNAPNMWIKYGLGEAEVDKTTVVNVSNVRSDMSYISKQVRAYADKVTAQTGEGSVKSMWKAVGKLPQLRKSGFVYSPESVIKHGGNCCSKARLLGEMLVYKGITGIEYVHIKRGSEGHVFLRLKSFNGKKNFYIDPSSQQEARGWGNYIKYLGMTVGKNLAHVTKFPNKPF